MSTVKQWNFTPLLQEAAEPFIQKTGQGMQRIGFENTGRAGRESWHLFYSLAGGVGKVFQCLGWRGKRWGKNQEHLTNSFTFSAKFFHAWFLLSAEFPLCWVNCASSAPVRDFSLLRASQMMSLPSPQEIGKSWECYFSHTLWIYVRLSTSTWINTLELEVKSIARTNRSCSEVRRSPIICFSLFFL